MLEPSAREELVELARSQLAAGAGHDDVLGEFRFRGLDKIDCVRLIAEATGLDPGEAKLLVHVSPVWADRRAVDEQVEEAFFHGLFVVALVDGGQVNEPDSGVVEFRERRERAGAQLREIAADVPDDMLAGYQELVAENLLGRAFATLVEAGERLERSGEYWAALAAVAETLCLNEFLGEREPAADDPDYVHAAYAVRRRTTR